MIREIFLTSYAAALMVTTLLMNERPRAEFLLVAPTVSLAHIAFSQALFIGGLVTLGLWLYTHRDKITIEEAS